ncbi:MAG: hypothetical protein R3225_05500 [Halofilum sp. (in: g-proteobacteria)]|nr:hypothetical protein [Halofilum sp. (in: g-proteobacteria)]
MNVPAVVSLALLALFLAVVAFNALVLATRQPDGSGPSVVPLLGGMAGAAGVWAWPYHELAAWAWLPLLLDPGCGWYLGGGAIVAGRRAWRFRARNCFARLVGDSSDKSVEIRLYRGGWATIRQTFHEPRTLGRFEAAGRWTQPDSGRGYVIRVWGASITLMEDGDAWTVVREDGWFREELALGPMRLAPDPE